jgi:hypothetical protein
MKLFQLILAALLASSPLAWTKPATKPGQQAIQDPACRTKNELVDIDVTPAESYASVGHGIIAWQN